MTKLDIIIPVYNEDENIVKLLKLIESKVSCDFRILICYDSESDKTLKFLKNSNIIKNEILLIKNPKQGPNSAIIEGIKSSEAKIISGPLKNSQLTTTYEKTDQGSKVIIDAELKVGLKYRFLSPIITKRIKMASIAVLYKMHTAISEIST